MSYVAKTLGSQKASQKAKRPAADSAEGEEALPMVDAEVEEAVEGMEPNNHNNVGDGTDVIMDEGEEVLLSESFLLANPGVAPGSPSPAAVAAVKVAAQQKTAKTAKADKAGARGKVAKAAAKAAKVQANQATGANRMSIPPPAAGLPLPLSGGVVSDPAGVLGPPVPPPRARPPPLLPPSSPQLRHRTPPPPPLRRPHLHLHLQTPLRPLQTPPRRPLPQHNLAPLLPHSPQLPPLRLQSQKQGTGHEAFSERA